MCFETNTNILAELYKFISYNHEANDFVDSCEHWDDFCFPEEGFAQPFFISPLFCLILIEIVVPNIKSETLLVCRFLILGKQFLELLESSLVK